MASQAEVVDKALAAVTTATEELTVASTDTSTSAIATSAVTTVEVSSIPTMNAIFVLTLY